MVTHDTTFNSQAQVMRELVKATFFNIAHYQEVSRMEPFPDTREGERP
jgi:hypothetical protein